jgi:hypothetical protein
MAAAADALAAALLRLCVIEDGSAAWADALAAVQSALAGCDSAGDASSAALAQATRDLCACAWDSDTWADARAVLADVLGQGGASKPACGSHVFRVRSLHVCVGPPSPLGLRQLLPIVRPHPHAITPPFAFGTLHPSSRTAGNTYLTWSLALPSHRHETLLLAPGEGDSILEVTPASLGIHQGLSPQALKVMKPTALPPAALPRPSMYSCSDLPVRTCRTARALLPLTAGRAPPSGARSRWGGPASNSGGARGWGQRGRTSDSAEQP